MLVTNTHSATDTGNLHFQDLCDTYPDRLTQWQRGFIQQLEDTKILNKIKNNHDGKQNGCFLLCTPTYYGKTTIMAKLTAALFVTTPHIKIRVTSLHRRNSSKFAIKFTGELKNFDHLISREKYEIMSNEKIQWSDRLESRIIEFSTASELYKTSEYKGRDLEHHLHVIDDYNYIVESQELDHNMILSERGPFTIFVGRFSREDNNPFTILIDTKNADGTKFFDQFIVEHGCKACENSRFCSHMFPKGTESLFFRQQQ